MSKVRIRQLADRGDSRGYSFTLPPDALEYLGTVRDVHVASIAPAAIRGNHCHAEKRAALLVVHRSDWSFHWDEGENSPVQRRDFPGCGAVLILIDPRASHAVRNDGPQTLLMISASSHPYDSSTNLARRVV